MRPTCSREGNAHPASQKNHTFYITQIFLTGFTNTTHFWFIWIHFIPTPSVSSQLRLRIQFFFILWFPMTIMYKFLLFPTCYICFPYDPPSSHQESNIFWRASLTKLITTWIVCTILCYLFSRTSKYSPVHMFKTTLLLLLNRSRNVSCIRLMFTLPCLWLQPRLAADSPPKCVCLGQLYVIKINNASPWQLTKPFIIHRTRAQELPVKWNQICLLRPNYTLLDQTVGFRST